MATVKSLHVTKGPMFDSWGIKAVADFTHEMLVKGTWKERPQLLSPPLRLSSMQTHCARRTLSSSRSISRRQVSHRRAARCTRS